MLSRKRKQSGKPAVIRVTGPSGSPCLRLLHAQCCAQDPGCSAAGDCCLSIGRLCGDIWSEVTARNAAPMIVAGADATAQLAWASSIGTRLPVDVQQHLPDDNYCVVFLSSRVLPSHSWQTFPQVVKKAGRSISTQPAGEAQFPGAAMY